MFPLTMRIVHIIFDDNHIENDDIEEDEMKAEITGAHTEPERCPYCGGPISHVIKAQIEKRERTQLARAEQALREQFARERERAEVAKKTELEIARREAAKAAETQIASLRANQDKIIEERIGKAREGFEKTLAEAVAVERTKAFEDRMKLDAQLSDLQRRLQRKTAGELGDEAEIDLFEALKAEFTGDFIARVAKGAPGADIVHRIVHNGTVAGVIVYDSKNHKRWLSKFVSKLRQDQRSHQADHAVLSTSAFPQGANQLHVEEGVIIAAPGRVVALVHMLRQHVMQTHLLRLGNLARDDKRDKLYSIRIPKVVGS